MDVLVKVVLDKEGWVLLDIDVGRGLDIPELVEEEVDKEWVNNNRLLAESSWIKGLIG